MLKIAYFLDLPQGLGGAGNVLINQAHLMSRDNNVVIVIPINEDGNENPEYARRCDEIGLRHVGLKYKTAFELQDMNVIEAYEECAIIESFLVDNGIQIIHSVQINAAVELASRKTGIPNLFNAYQIRKGEFCLPQTRYLPCYHSADSELYCKIWREQLGIESRCIRPISPLEKIKNYKKYGGKTINIVMLGYVCDRKNQLSGIKAIQRIHDQYNVRLYILGNVESKYGEKCINYVEENRLQKFIFFKGFVENVGEYLENGDIYLCTSVDESFPSSMVEAASHGLMVVSTPVAGIPELMKDGYNAYLSSDFEIESLKVALCRCLGDYISGSNVAIYNNLKSTWENYFSQDVIRGQLQEYYDYILDKDIVAKFEDDNFISEVSIIRDKLINVFKKDDFVLNKVYYYAHLKQILKPDSKVAIWGCGDYGYIATKIIKSIMPKLRIVCYVDSYKNGYYSEKEIIEPDKIREKRIDYVFVSVFEYRIEILNKLNDLDYKYNQKAWILP